MGICLEPKIFLRFSSSALSSSLRYAHMWFILESNPPHILSVERLFLTIFAGFLRLVGVVEGFVAQFTDGRILLSLGLNKIFISTLLIFCYDFVVL